MPDICHDDQTSHVDIPELKATPAPAPVESSPQNYTPAQVPPQIARAAFPQYEGTTTGTVSTSANVGETKSPALNFVGEVFNAFSPFKSEEKPHNAVEGAVQEVEGGHKALDLIQKLLPHGPVAEGMEHVLGPIGAALGGYNMATGGAELANAHDEKETRSSVAKIMGGAADIAGNIPVVGTAVSTGLKVATPIANFMSDTAAQADLYGGGRNIEEHAADLAVSVANRPTHDVDENGVERFHPAGGGPSVGGMLLAGGAAVADGLTWQARMAAKGVEWAADKVGEGVHSIKNAVFGKSDAEKAADAAQAAQTHATLVADYKNGSPATRQTIDNVSGMFGGFADTGIKQEAEAQQRTEALQAGGTLLGAGTNMMASAMQLPAGPVRDALLQAAQATQQGALARLNNTSEQTEAPPPAPSE